MDNNETIWIKKEEPDEIPNEPGSMVHVHCSSVEVKEELEEDENEEFGDEPLGISCSTDYINEEPEVILEVDETGTIVGTSPRYELDSTRFTKNSTEGSGMSFEDLVKQEVVSDQLEKATEKSTHVSMCSTQIQGQTSEEDTVFGTRLKCSLREKEFQKFSCSFCLQSFPSKYRLIMHVFMHIDGVQPPRYVCKSCGEVFSSNFRLSKHLTMREDVKTLSFGSNDTFDSSSDCKNISLEGDKELSFMEPMEKPSSSKETWIFPKKFFNGINNTHTITHDAENLNKHDNYGTLSKTGDINDQFFQHTAKRRHKCDFCGKSFTHSSHLKAHALIHTGTKPHKCDTCGKSFTQMGTLKRHVYTHTGQKPHKCIVCGKDFSKLCQLKSHILIHSGKRAHKCDICGNCFTDRSILRRHSVLHTGVRPNKCDICGKSFTLMGDLRRHTLTHTIKKPNTCDICGASFTQLDDLKRHALIHIGTRPHICDICGKCFTQSGSLKRHALRHTGMRSHKCEICGKSFTELDTLKRHSSIHTGEKPHQCDICGKSFSLVVYLKRHSLIHTGIKPYKCDICDKSFIDSNTLKRHSLVHSRMTPHIC